MLQNMSDGLQSLLHREQEVNTQSVALLASLVQPEKGTVAVLAE